MNIIKNLSDKQRTAVITVAAGLAIVIAGAVVIRLAQPEAEVIVEEVSPSANPIETPTPSPTITGVDEPSPSASPTVSSSPAVPLPESARTFVSNFFGAYSEQDKARLEAAFAPDTDDEQRSVRARLFTGRDVDGTPGGPTLFQTNTASERAVGYVILSSQQQGSGWVISLQEQRVNGTGDPISPVSTVVVLAPSTNPTGSWLITSYNRVGQQTKYSGFLL